MNRLLHLVVASFVFLTARSSDRLCHVSVSHWLLSISATHSYLALMRLKSHVNRWTLFHTPCMHSLRALPISPCSNHLNAHQNNSKRPAPFFFFPPFPFWKTFAGCLYAGDRELMSVHPVHSSQPPQPQPMTDRS